MLQYIRVQYLRMDGASVKKVVWLAAQGAPVGCEEGTEQRSIFSQKHLGMELRLGPEPGRATGVGARLGWYGLEFGRDGDEGNVSKSSRAGRARKGFA